MAATTAQAQGPFPPPVPASTARPAAVPAVPNARPQLVPADAAGTGTDRVILLQKTPGSSAPAPGGPLPEVPAPGLPDVPVLQQAPHDGFVQKVAPQTDADRKAAEKGPPVTSAAPSGITRDAAFRLESNEQLLARVTRELVNEARLRTERDKKETFRYDPEYYRVPAEPRLAGADQPFQPKTLTYPPYQLAIEPGYVVHRRLHFEEPNSERHLWELGIAQPVVSALYFYKDVLLWPASLASDIHERYDTSAGKCPPGSPYPYSLYPPEIDLLGLGAETSILVGAAFLFP